MDVATTIVDWVFLIGLFFAAAKIGFDLYEHGDFDNRVALLAILSGVLYAFVLYFRYAA